MIATMLTALVIFCGGVCQEDEPCWNCHTMGNKICGTNYTGWKVKAI